MAKQSDKNKKQKPATSEADKRTRYYMLGLFLLFVAIYIAVSCASYLAHWKDDEDIARWQSIFNTDIDEVGNIGGRLGAVVGDTVISQWFGLFGFFIPVILILISLRIMKFQPLYMRKSLRISLFSMFIGSILLGFISIELFPSWEVFGSGLGGKHGFFVSMWLISILGSIGAGLLILLAVIALAIYINRNTISFLNKVGKGIVDNTVKVGSTVGQKAADYIVSHKDDDPAVTEPETTEPEPEDEPVKEDLTFRDDTYYDEDDIDRHKKVEPIPQPRNENVDFDFEVKEAKTINDLYADQSAVNSYEDGEFVVTSFNEPIPDEEQLSEPVTTETTFIDGEEFEITTLGEEELLSDDEIDNNELYDPTLDLSSYQKPSIDLLKDHRVDVVVTEEELVENKNKILKTLDNFGISIDKIKATIGPTVTLYEIIPAPGVRISKIKNLEDDIALSLSALGIRIIAPIPGKGTIGIEVPNKNKEIVSMYSAVKSPKFQETDYDLPVVLGKTIQNETFVIDLAKMPHLLVAGATGQGKSVGLNAIITSLLYKKHPSELKFVLVDPKKVELTLYSKLEKHFLAKMPGEDDAIITDTQKVIYTLNSLCVEMDTRYDLLKKASVRNIKEYNDKFIRRRLNPENGHRYLPYIVVIIDEFADMIMTAGREIETPIARLAQLARAIGIHLVIATQRPTTNIITGLIKSNFPARIAFRVTSMIDSRTILDQPGANQLIGRGDMLVSSGSDVIRVQCAFVDTPEIEDITKFIGDQRGYSEPYELPEYVPETEMTVIRDGSDLSKRDGLFDEAARLIVINQQGSTSLIQRKFSIGYSRAGRIMDQLEQAGIVGKVDGSKPRQVLISDLNSLERLLLSLDNMI